MKQNKECPTCKGHGLLKIDTKQRFFLFKLDIFNFIGRILRKIIKGEEP